MDLSYIRDSYKKDQLLEGNLPADPVILFQTWFDLALKSEVKEPNAMALATSTLDGVPSVRIVLLKQFNSDGFIFYSNYLSRKGEELNQNPRAAFTIWWPPLECQVRVEGIIKKLSFKDSKKYFDSRPEGSRRGAIASPQSQIILDRAYLENRLDQTIQEGDLDMPAHWGGYLIEPSAIEFWQGRERRLHDRIVYERIKKEDWAIKRLAP